MEIAKVLSCYCALGVADPAYHEVACFLEFKHTTQTAGDTGRVWTYCVAGPRKECRWEWLTQKYLGRRFVCRTPPFLSPRNRGRRPVYTAASRIAAVARHMRRRFGQCVGAVRQGSLTATAVDVNSDYGSFAASVEFRKPDKQKEQKIEIGGGGRKEEDEAMGGGQALFG